MRRLLLSTGAACTRGLLAAGLLAAFGTATAGDEMGELQSMFPSSAWPPSMRY